MIQVQFQLIDNLIKKRPSVQRRRAQIEPNGALFPAQGAFERLRFPFEQSLFPLFLHVWKAGQKEHPTFWSKFRV